jgi:hypothetical protein
MADREASALEDQSLGPCSTRDEGFTAGAKHG